MTFELVLPWWVFSLAVLVIMVLRIYTLYRVLVVVGKGGQRKFVLRWSLLTLAILCVLTAVARPGIDPTQQARSMTNTVAAQGSNLNVFFVVDRSINSRAEDYGDDLFRMAGIRSDMSALVDQYPKARFSITSFATTARVDWPLSDDVWSLRALLKGYSAYVSNADSVYQVDVGAAADSLKRQLELAHQQFPGSSNLVFYLGEGAGASRVTAQKFDIPTGLIAGGAVLGYGTSAGGAVASQLSADGQRTYFTDPDGSGGAFLPTLDEASLKSVARQLRVPYFHRYQGDSALTIVPAVDSSGERGESRQPKLLENRAEFYWVFTAMAMALLFCEVYAMTREYRMSRITKVPPR